ncbi:NHL repeat-containing protein [Variovorax sp. EL159]|nr:NHL repeat-containing protein [Variovorax sp. EL159]
MTDGKSNYRMVRPWQKPSPRGAVGVISQLALDSRGRVFVLQRTAPQLLIYRADGELDEVYENPRLTSGHGLFIDAADNVYLVSYDAHQVLALDASLKLRFELGGFNTPRWGAPFNHPTDVAVAPDGEIYVSDGYGNACVHRFSAGGEHLGTWGGVGQGLGEFSTPHGVWVLADNRVAVCDRDNDRVQLFDREGRFLAQWTGLLRPMDIWSDGCDVFVTEQAPRVTRLDMSGAVRGRFRSFGVYGHGLWGAADGSLFVAEQGHGLHCVTKYERIGPAQA